MRRTPAETVMDRTPLGRRLVEISRRLAARLGEFSFKPPITHAYNPLIYARRPHEAYLLNHAAPRPAALLLGMNPGPWGMAQTGIPFGEVGAVRDWMAIDAPVDRPMHEHPKRPVTGLACPRSEVSGRRLWGWARARFGSPERFFRQFFVVNYCPLMLLDAQGRNLTPDKLPATMTAPMFHECDRALIEIVEVLQPRFVVGVGAFAEHRATAALAGQAIRIGRIPHPSPASPIANRGWEARINTALSGLGLLDLDPPASAADALGATRPGRSKPRGRGGLIPR